MDFVESRGVASRKRNEYLAGVVGTSLHSKPLWIGCGGFNGEFETRRTRRTTKVATERRIFTAEIAESAKAIAKGIA